MRHVISQRLNMNHQLKDFNYQIIGDDSSPKLVFLHGILGRGKNWQSIAKNFSKNFQCLIYDQRGHGQSVKPTKGYELSDYANDLKLILDSLEWKEPIYLVGHSMGGRVALAFATQFPERLKKLVIVDIGPTSDWSSMQGILDKIRFVPTPFASREEARSFMENEFLSKYKSKMLMEFFYSNLREQEGEMDWIFEPKAIEQTLENSRRVDYWAEFKALKVPTLLIRGGQSEDLSQKDYEQVLANNPQILGTVVEDVGHWVHAEKPLETIEIIRTFFNMDEDTIQ